MKIIKRSRKNPKSFKGFWKLAREKRSHQIQSSLDVKNDTDDSYFEHKPSSQDQLTMYGMTSENIVDFSSYIQTPFQQINNNNLHDCFHGILSYIFFYSGNKLNTEEIEFYFSGAELYKGISNNRCDDVLNIFDYTNEKTSFKIRPIKNAFFGVTFKRIKIKPVSYSIRLGPFPSSSFFVSFNLEAYNEETQKWDVLDERNNLHFISPQFLTRLFANMSKNVYYSSFRIHQTEPNNDQIWGFELVAFDIHGEVLYRETEEKLLFRNFLNETIEFGLQDSDSNPDISICVF